MIFNIIASIVCHRDKFSMKLSRIHALPRRSMFKQSTLRIERKPTLVHHMECNKHHEIAASTQCEKSVH